MEYKEHTPSPTYQNVVHSYWAFKVFDHEALAFPIKHETLPDSCLSIVAIQQPYFQGVRALSPHSKKFEIDVFPNSAYVGIRFHPWIEFQDIFPPKVQIINQTIATPEVVQDCFTSLIASASSNEATIAHIEECLSTFLTRTAVKENNLVKYLCFHLDSGKSIGEVTETIPSSIRVIQKKFKEVTGITMRQYTTNSRLRRLWIDLIKYPNEKREIVYLHNYYDQSHFINDFKKKMNRSYADFKAYMDSVDVSVL